MKPIRIIDKEFRLLGEIDDYESLIWTRRWHRTGEFELHINANKQYTEYLKRGNIVILSKDKVGIIKHREGVIDGKGKGGEELIIIGSSLSSIIGRRITIPPEGQAYHKLSSNVEMIMKEYVRFNCIEPVDIKRKIPRFEVAPIKGLGGNIVYQTRFKSLEEELEKLSIVSGLGWDISLNFDDKDFIFDVYEGRNLVAGQSQNPPVLFSIDYDNVRGQKFIDSEIGYKNIAYVGGQGEGVDRNIVRVGEEKEGLERYEVFIDARDIEKVEELPERGMQKLAEMRMVSSFESEILPYGPFKYEKNWDLGDVVTIANPKWGITEDLRIVEVKEIYEKSGFKLEVLFGEIIPTLIEKIKSEIDMPLIEMGGGEGGTGVPGSDGVGIEYNWVDTKLGIKREDEEQFQYVDLKGDIGPQGPAGSDANVTYTNVVNALGFMPAKDSSIFKHHGVKSSIDFNNLLEDGFYIISGGSLVNAPTSTNYYGLLVLNNFSSSKIFLHQLAFRDGYNEIYVRCKSSSTWTSWVRAV